MLCLLIMFDIKALNCNWQSRKFFMDVFVYFCALLEGSLLKAVRYLSVVVQRHWQWWNEQSKVRGWRLYTNWLKRVTVLCLQIAMCDIEATRSLKKQHRGLNRGCGWTCFYKVGNNWCHNPTHFDERFHVTPICKTMASKLDQKCWSLVCW